MTKHAYVAFGLGVESTWSIPSLAHGPSGRSADVQIVEGEVRAPVAPSEVDGIKVGIDGDKLILEIDDAGRFEIAAGRKIIIDPAPGATRDQVNLYLLGSVFGALLHQRRLLPFHCNAVEIDGSALLFCGDSGAGKSTLAAYFVERGFRLLSDDLCALRVSGGGAVMAAPGAARLKLWQETLDAFGRTSEGLKLLPWYEDKFEVPLETQDWHGSFPVAAIYHLRIAEEGRPAGIHALRGLRAVNAVTANIYRRRLADLAGATGFYLEATARIVGQVPAYTVNRHWGFHHFREEALALERHMLGLVDKTNAELQKPA